MNVLCKLIVEGKEFNIEIMDPELQKLVAPKKRTGYEIDEERVKWFDNAYNGVEQFTPIVDDHKTYRYQAANYYTDKTVAENNARADRLMRRLRRFAVEHRKKDIDWSDYHKVKYTIHMDYTSKNGLEVSYSQYVRDFANIYFDTKETAALAIEEFHDELIWYFTEYKDSL